MGGKGKGGGGYPWWQHIKPKGGGKKGDDGEREAKKPKLGWSLGHWFVAVRRVSKIGVMIRSFVTCKWVFSVFLKRLYREATNQ